MYQTPLPVSFRVKGSELNAHGHLNPLLIMMNSKIKVVFTPDSILLQTQLYLNVSTLPSTQFNGHKNILRKIAAAQLMDIYFQRHLS